MFLPLVCGSRHSFVFEMERKMNSDFQNSSETVESDPTVAKKPDHVTETGKSGKKHRKLNPFAKGLLCGILICVTVVTVIGAGFLGNGSAVNLASIQKLQSLEKIIDTSYYKKVKSSDLEDGMYKGIFEGLDDPYSAYYTKKEYKDLMAQMTGSYAGIGATLSKTDGGEGVCQIVSTYEGSPAGKAGLVAGDVIESADGKSAADYDLEDFVQFIRGSAGSVVSLKVQHADGSEETVKVTRENIQVPTVSYQMANDSIGYVRIDQFTESTYDEYQKAMQDLESKGMKAVIFDLRYNGGGLVDSVTKILNQILPKGTSVYMLDRNGKRTDYTSDGKHELKMPIAVLTSENTASAAEIFSGAIRDYHKGTLIGQKTFGKGIVQQTMPLPDGSAIKITIETYYTPSGECIHKKGIKPDIQMDYEYTGSTDSSSYDILKDNEVNKGIEVLTSEVEDE